MNIYKNLMFLHGHFTDPHMDDGYTTSYGNRTANARSLRESWESAHEAVARTMVSPAPSEGACRACQSIR